MNIHLSKELENSIQAAVRNGQFAQVDEALAEAARLLLKEKPLAGKKPLTSEEFDQQLLDLGLMSHLPGTNADFDDPEDRLVDIRGEPLSQTVIRERR